MTTATTTNEEPQKKRPNEIVNHAISKSIENENTFTNATIDNNVKENLLIELVDRASAKNKSKRIVCIAKWNKIRARARSMRGQRSKGRRRKCVHESVCCAVKDVSVCCLPADGKTWSRTTTQFCESKCNFHILVCLYLMSWSANATFCCRRASIDFFSHCMVKRVNVCVPHESKHNFAGEIDFEWNWKKKLRKINSSGEHQFRFIVFSSRFVLVLIDKHSMMLSSLICTLIKNKKEAEISRELRIHAMNKFMHLLF